MLTELLRDFVGLFYPNYCLGCRGALVKGEDTLCTACIVELPRVYYPDPAQNPIVDRFIGKIPVKYGWSMLRFHKTGIVQNLMHEFKYNRHPEVGLLLGKIFGSKIKKAAPFAFDVAVPVPLHPSKMRSRGYNQSAMLAAGLAGELGVPIEEHALKRLAATATQTKKGRLERWHNVSEAFVVQYPSRVAQKRILLVDDVITTGATVEACGRALLDAGASEISIACLAEA